MRDESWRGLLPDKIRRARGLIYHYTDPGGLVGAIQKKELWATEATGMNDLAEVRQGWAFIREWLKEQVDDDVTRIIQSMACGDPSDADSDSYDGVSGIFMCCASTRGDDANQWRLYANGGRGYAVALDASVPLTAVVDGSDPRGPHRSGFVTTVREFAVVSPWLHVLYREKAKLAALDGLLEAGRKGWTDALAKSSSEDERERDKEELWELMGTGLATIAQLMKSEGFAGENEVRTIVYDPFQTVSQFRASQNGVIQYVRLTQEPTKRLSHRARYEDDLGAEKTLPLRSVRLGPLLHAQNNKATVMHLLRRNGFGSATAEESGVPLR